MRDAWAEPDSQVDALFCGFWLGHVPDGRLDAFLALVLRWLRPGGRFVFIDGLPDPEADAVDQAPSDADGIQERRLADGRRFRIVQVSRTPGILADALRRAGFESPEVTRTDRFFVMGSGVRPG